MSKSMPAQNALPLPVKIATRAWLFSIWSSAVCNSAIICVETALRFSGRFSVIVARFPAISRRSVWYMAATSPDVRTENCSRIWQNHSVHVILVHQRCMRVLRANLVRHFERLGQPRRINSRIGARFAQCCKNVFGRDVPDQIVSRKRAAAKPRQRAIEPAAPSFVRRKDFFFSILGPAVQVNSEFDAGDVILYGAIQIADELRRSRAHG